MGVQETFEHHYSVGTRPRTGDVEKANTGLAASFCNSMSQILHTTSDIFEKNLRSVARLSPAAARAIAASEPRAGVELLETQDGSWSIRIDGRLAASGYDPLREGRLLAEQAPVESAACIVVIGFAAGHHVAALAERMNRSGAILVYEPDVGLLRSILEARDISAWMDRSNVVMLVTEEQAAITTAITGLEGLLAAGVKILEHPASQRRIGRDRIDAFSASLTSVMRAVKTNVVTTFVQVETTLRNLLMNVDRYATVPGIADLQDAAKGVPAVVVSAGPSLERNIELLSDPANRAKVVVVAAQTVLKKLLARGIRPDFVTALDYHEISRRFYEGLTGEDVEGVTLVVEPKANPAILSAFPGLLRCPGDRILDELLGPFSREMGSLTPGATVAHLAYYLARYLGCDPVILIGQDLGFTDGQYYHAGAAIHRVWAGELNEFNTLEMLEWQRIVRSRNILHRAVDHLGRPIYSDEQMMTYLVQFERDFAEDAAAGRTTIDATEGGVVKKHTLVRTLREVLAEIPARVQPVALPRPQAVRATDDKAFRARLREHIAAVRRDAWAVEEISRKTASKLEEMIGSDQKRIAGLIDQVHRLRDEIVTLQPAYNLVGFLNQTGGFKRFQADRAIELDRSLTPLERQKRQITRDITNVSWIGDAAQQLGSMLDSTIRMLDGGPRITRDVSAVEAVEKSQKQARRVVCTAFIPCTLLDAGVAAEPIVPGKSALRLTLERLRQSAQIDGVVLARDPAGHAERVAAEMKFELRPGVSITLVDMHAAAVQWSRRVRRVRKLSERCWRGGPANLTIWDELWRPAELLRLMRLHGADAAVLVGAEWAMLDAALTDSVIARHRESPEMHPVTFSPAAPGLAPAVLGRELVEQLAERESTARMFATLGGVLGYVPALPRQDPIAKPPCVETPIELRDAGRRCIADTPSVRRMLSQVGAPAADLGPVPSAELVRHLSATSVDIQELVVDLAEQRDPSARLMARLVELAPNRCAEDLALTLLGSEADIESGRAGETVHAAARAGFRTIHFKSQMAMNPDSATGFIDALGMVKDAVVIVSVPMHAHRAETYDMMMGSRPEGGHHANSIQNVRRLVRLSRSTGDAVPGIPGLWVVPRITRQDAVYQEIEEFYDAWLMEAGACVIDPLPAPRPGERIAPLPRPAWVDELEAAASRRVQALH